MANQDIDGYVVEHHRSMSVREMADKLECSKSTVSRHMAALREAGRLDDSAARSASEATAEARAGIAEGMSPRDRLAALMVLADRLRDELDQTGGANLARVSSEYRHTLEQVEALSAETEAVRAKACELNPAQLASMRVKVCGKFNGKYDHDMVSGMFDAIMYELDGFGAVKVSPVDMVISATQAYYEIGFGDYDDE